MKTDAKSRKTSTQKPTVQPSQAYYEIKVQGHLDRLWEPWFEGMTLTNIKNGENGLACTLISGPVVDQAALHGLLTRIRDLNLILISVSRTDPDRPAKESPTSDLHPGEGS